MSVNIVHVNDNGKFKRYDSQACFSMLEGLAHKGEKIGVVINLFSDEDASLLYDMLCDVGYKNYLVNSKSVVMKMRRPERYIMFKGNTPFFAALAGMSLCRIQTEHKQHWKCIKLLLENGCDPYVAWLYSTFISVGSVDGKLQWHPGNGHSHLTAGAVGPDALQNIRRWQFRQRGELRIKDKEWNHAPYFPRKRGKGLIQTPTFTKAVCGDVDYLDNGSDFLALFRKVCNINTGGGYRSRFSASKSNNFAKGLVWMYEQSGLSKPPEELLKLIEEKS